MEQNDSINKENESNSTSLSKKSWLAYVLLLGGFACFTVFVVSLLSAFSSTAAAVLAVLMLTYMAYLFLYLRSVHLYCNDDGVWVYGGVLPWQKGNSGVKWRDLDEATYQTSFTSWLFKAYSMRIGHRFTKASEMNMSFMHRGNEAVEYINSYHRKYIQNTD